jgi:TRAP-type transport system small permease protein
VLVLQEAAGVDTGLGALARRACDVVARAVRLVILALVGVMLVSLTLQVVMRYVFNRAPSWSEELAVTCFSWSMLLAIALGVRDAIHVRMDLLVDRLPLRWRSALERVVSLAIAFTGGFIAWAGVHYVRDSFGTTSAAMGYPTAYLYACAPVCGALVTLFALERACMAPAPQAAP